MECLGPGPVTSGAMARSAGNIMARGVPQEVRAAILSSSLGLGEGGGGGEERKGGEGK